MQSLDHHTSLMRRLSQQPATALLWETEAMGAGGCERETGPLFPYTVPSPPPPHSLSLFLTF